jgi:Xaa-Pro dipeptidase
MPQAAETSAATYRQRLARLQDAMNEFGLQAVVLEPGPAMQYLTGVRWGKSERTFAVVLPAKGEPVWVLPGFEEMRARELIHLGKDDIRVWQEDESPYTRIVAGLKDRGAGAPGSRIGIDEAARFFVFDGVRKLAPKLEYTGTRQVLRAAGADAAPTGSGRK